MMCPRPGSSVDDAIANLFPEDTAKTETAQNVPETQPAQVDSAEPQHFWSEHGSAPKRDALNETGIPGKESSASVPFHAMASCALPVRGQPLTNAPTPSHLPPLHSVEDGTFGQARRAFSAVLAADAPIADSPHSETGIPIKNLAATGEPLTPSLSLGAVQSHMPQVPQPVAVSASRHFFGPAGDTVNLTSGQSAGSSALWSSDQQSTTPAQSGGAAAATIASVATLLEPGHRSRTSTSFSTQPSPKTDVVSSGNASEDDSTDGKEKKPRRKVTPWSEAEHALFLQGLERFRTTNSEEIGRNGEATVGLGAGIAELISIIVGTRTAAQVRSHAQKHFQRLRREQKADAPRK